MSREHKTFPANSVDKTKQVSSMKLIEPLDRFFPFGVSVEMDERKKRVTLKMSDGKKTVREITLSEGALVNLAKKLLLG